MRVLRSLFGCLSCVILLTLIIGCGLLWWLVSLIH